MNQKGSIAERLAENSVPEPNTGCVLWLGYVDEGGYGKMTVAKVSRSAHRLAWAEAYGAIPVGMGVLHKCDQPSCIRPSHLFLGTNADNVRDMARKKRDRNSKKTHCQKGHKFSGDNLHVGIYRGRSYRGCRACGRLAKRREGIGGHHGK